MPPSVSTVKAVLEVKPFSYTSFAVLRSALPHISASLPSGLNTRIRKSAFADGQIRIIPSEPTPKRRRDRKRAQADGFSIRCVSSSTYM